MDKMLRTARSDPLGFIEHEHSLHLYLCDLLEQIADSLPDNVDLKTIEAAIYSIDGLFQHHKLEENCLFPLLKERAGPEDNIERILKHLKMEHASDESLASEVQENLERLALRQPPDNPDMLGYMLRALFENYRRHISWEDAVLLPLLRAHLTSDDLLKLANSLEQELSANRS